MTLASRPSQEWGTNTSQVQHLYDPIEQMLEKEAPHIHERYPKTWSTSTQCVNLVCAPSQASHTLADLVPSFLCSSVGRHLRNILLSEELCAFLPLRPSA